MTTKAERSAAIAEEAAAEAEFQKDEHSLALDTRTPEEIAADDAQDEFDGQHDEHVLAILERAEVGSVFTRTKGGWQISYVINGSVLPVGGATIPEALASFGAQIPRDGSRPGRGEFLNPTGPRFARRRFRRGAPGQHPADSLPQDPTPVTDAPAAAVDARGRRRGVNPGDPNTTVDLDTQFDADARAAERVVPADTPPVPA